MDEYEQSKCNTLRYKKIKVLMKMIYGYDEFRPHQYEIINKIVSGEDVCAVLPTGHGKSITFQIPAVYIDKPAIVISPLKSLMNDQKIILDKLGLTSCCYNGDVVDKEGLRKEMLRGDYQFIYITPESIVNLKNFLITLNTMQGISLIAIDEAHCISSYGHEFRKEYRQITFFKEMFPNVPILAVTATATNEVGLDICKVLQMKDGTVPIKSSFDRPNLYLEVRRKTSKTVHSNPIARDIVTILNEHKDKPAIVYCLTKKETVEIAGILKSHHIKTGVYHSAVEAEKKEKVHKKFLENKLSCVCATNAFGMGINKSNVRVVIHYGCPKNIEGYYQEIGRAGRDGKKGYCYTFYSDRDFKLNESFIQNEKNVDNARRQMMLLKQMRRYVETCECRRKVLLDYFDEDTDDLVCDFCDNCCGVDKEEEKKHIVTKQQDVQSEAKMLIDLIEDISNTGKNAKFQKAFGVKMYINILRGSKEKGITPELKANRYYGKGSDKSVAWWKELADKLVEKGYLQQVNVRGKFMIQVIKVTRKGLEWSAVADLGDIIPGIEQMNLFEMIADK